MRFNLLLPALALLLAACGADGDEASPVTVLPVETTVATTTTLASPTTSELPASTTDAEPPATSTTTTTTIPVGSIDDLEIGAVEFAASTSSTNRA